jgi:glutaredoxin 3
LDVRIYTTPTCGYCHQVKSFLDGLGVNFVEYDVSRDRNAAEEMVNLTGQMGVPVIVINGQPVIGFNRPRLEELLSRSNGQRPRLGMKVADVNSSMRKPGEPPLFGAIVGDVFPSTPASRAGFRKGDIITSVNRQRINKVSEMEQVIHSVTAGNRIPVTVYRGEQAINLEIML